MKQVGVHLKHCSKDIAGFPPIGRLASVFIEFSGAILAESKPDPHASSTIAILVRVLAYFALDIASLILHFFILFHVVWIIKIIEVASIRIGFQLRNEWCAD